MGACFSQQELAPIQVSEEKKLPKLLENEYKEVAWGMENLGEKFKPIWIARPNCREMDVKFELLYCGICHSDCVTGENSFGQTVFPLVPGHELLGRVVEVGKSVTKFKVGDTCAVGCFVDSCLDCSQCKNGNENYCDKQQTFTYQGKKTHGRVSGNPNTLTMGGYSGSYVVHESFCLKIPNGMPLELSAPILCAGVTMYSPLEHWGFTKGVKKTVGIIAIGGLGTMGIKIARALGHDVVAVSTSAKKEAMAREKGATHFVVSKDPESIAKHAGMCDILLNTVSANHDLNLYLPLLAKSGILVQIGAALQPHTVSQIPLMFERKTIAGSLIGGIRETQEVIDLCAKHKIYPDCKIIQANQIDWAWSQLNGPGGNSDGIRYVIDIKKSLANPSFVPN